MTDLLARFVSAFRRGIEGELAAMRASTEPFEIALERGEDLGALRYSFALTTTDRVDAGAVCVLKTSRGEQRITIERIDEGRITITAAQAIDTSDACALVVAPWFLYERL